MGAVSVLFTIASLFCLILAILVVWSRRNRVMRWVSVAIALATIPLLYQGAVNMLSRARPVGFDFFEKKVTLEGYYLENKISLYVMIREEGKEPRLYIIKWEEGMEERIDELIKALKVQKETGRRVTIESEKDGEEHDVFSNVPFPQGEEK